MLVKAHRSENNPIIRPDMDDRIGTNINGPSLLRVPDWIDNPLGKYYLYFAHHQGKFIRMAYADHIAGPYTVYAPGVLDMEDAPFTKHIASPDVHIDSENRTLYMYYHGAGPEGPCPYGQATCYSESADGLQFTTDRDYLGPSYMRVVQWEGACYGFPGGGARETYRSTERRKPFEQGPRLHIEGEPFTDSATHENVDSDDVSVYRTRHTAVHLRGHELDLYYSNAGDTPERIKCTTLDLRKDWTEWRGTAPEEILRTETSYEGIDQPLVPSEGGSIHERVHQVRDPYLFVENNTRYLLYSVAGETGIGLAELIED